MTQPATTEQGKRRRDPRNTRERLVRAALELFTTIGYHAATTPQIAQKARVAEGTIYRHFSSKEQMLNEIYRGAARLFTTQISQTPTGESCRARLEKIALAWREVAQRDPALVRLVFVSRVEVLLDERSRQVAAEFRSELEKVLASGKAAGEVRPGPVEVWADVWLRLTALVLDKTAARQWGPDSAAPGHVITAAWDAIAARPLSSS